MVGGCLAGALAAAGIVLMLLLGNAGAVSTNVSASLLADIAADAPPPAAPPSPASAGLALPTQSFEAALESRVLPGLSAQSAAQLASGFDAVFATKTLPASRGTLFAFVAAQSGDSTLHPQMGFVPAAGGGVIFSALEAQVALLSGAGGYSADIGASQSATAATIRNLGPLPLPTGDWGNGLFLMGPRPLLLPNEVGVLRATHASLPEFIQHQDWPFSVQVFKNLADE